MFPPCVYLRVLFNDHAIGYKSLADWLVDNSDGTPECWFDWVSPEERTRALATNSVWTAQWYPETPVRFNALAASSFEALLEGMNR